MQTNPWKSQLKYVSPFQILLFWRRWNWNAMNNVIKFKNAKPAMTFNLFNNSSISFFLFLPVTLNCENIQEIQVYVK